MLGPMRINPMRAGPLNALTEFDWAWPFGLLAGSTCIAGLFLFFQGSSLCPWALLNLHDYFK